MTSAQAAKELKRLNEMHDALIAREKKVYTFTAAVQEDVESVRPAYDYAATQQELADIEQKIRKLKHTINLFNLNTQVPGFDMTIDQMLVYIPQLSTRKKKLERMRDKLPREREIGGYSRNSNIIEYSYANYDVDKAQKDFQAVADELARAQNALDQVNSTVEF